MSPSDLGGAKVMPGETHDGDTEAALLRGTLIHRLLEYLPMAKADDRKALGLKLVGDQDAALVDDVIGLIGKDALSWIWDDAALAEVDLTADIPGLGRIHGAIDRLLIADQKVTAVDFKSNRIVPKTPSATPSGLQRQMAAYYYALAAIYPDHQIEVGILWTNSASFMVIPEDILHEALKDIATP